MQKFIILILISFMIFSGCTTQKNIDKETKAENSDFSDGANVEINSREIKVNDGEGNDVKISFDGIDVKSSDGDRVKIDFDSLINEDEFK